MLCGFEVIYDYAICSATLVKFQFTLYDKFSQFQPQYVVRIPE